MPRATFLLKFRIRPVSQRKKRSPARRLQLLRGGGLITIRIPTTSVHERQDPMKGGKCREPNKTPEPTFRSVTSPAAQEPRQP